MSEPFASTDEKCDIACPTCGGHAVVRKMLGLYGSVVWSIEGHDAPCGLPCFAGGVGIKAYRSGQVHRSDECPRCDAP